MNIAETDRQPVRSPAVWHASDLSDTSEWAIAFTDDERDEIVDASRRAARGGATVATVTAGDFPLPTLAPKIDAWAGELASGRGFVMLRRFPVDRLTALEVEVGYVGFGAHLGTPVAQDPRGTLLGHVRDERVPRNSPAVRLYRTSERQDFHTDAADLVGLLCLRPAASGGESKIVSSFAVYNEMLARRPDLVDVLYQPLYWDWNDEQPEGEQPFFGLPTFADIDGMPRITYIGWYIHDAQRHAETPRLTPAQREAMDFLEATANDPRFWVAIDFWPGDLQLLNNARIMHCREAYTDGEDAGHQRHLLRLWLVAHQFATVESSMRCGIPRRGRAGARPR